MSGSEQEFNVEQYKAVYEFQQKQFEQAKSQSVRLDDKAAKYLTFTTLMITAVSLFAKNYFFDVAEAQRSILYYLIVGLIFLIFLTLVSIARALFNCLRINDVAKLSANLQMVEYWLDQPRATVFYELAKQLSGVIETYDAANDEKLKNLKHAFKEIKFCGLLLVASVILIVLEITVI